MQRSAAVYCRISRDAEGEGLGVARQEKDCVAEVKRRGWTLHEVYVDNDLSAYSGKPRPAYCRMMDDVKNGVVNAVVVWAPDRLHRSTRELEDFIDLVDITGCAIVTVSAGVVDLTVPEGRAMARIVGTMARQESEVKSRRLRRKALELAERGRVSGGGNRPFGFNDDRRTIREDEAERIREAARRVLAGDSLYAITADWTAAGVQTSTGVPWSTTSLKSTLTRPRVAGLREYHGTVVGQAEWPAILPEETWRAVSAILNDPSRRRTHPRRAYLLTGGLSVCGECGAPLSAAPRHERTGYKRAYACKKERHGGCGGVSVLADSLEELVVDLVLAAFDSPEFVAAVRRAEAGGEDEAVLASIREDEARLDDLGRMWADGQIDQRGWVAASERINARLVESRARLARIAKRPASAIGDPAVLRAAWPDMSLDRQRSVIGTIVKAVVLHRADRPRTRFNPDRVEIRWRY
ncbi:MAG TPA: recombinase family protein [Acidimicrobiales bacterium]